MRIISKSVFLFIIATFIVTGVFAQRRNEQIVRVETTTWLRKNFISFAYERSLGASSITLAVGGGWLGKDNHYLPPNKINSLKEADIIKNSQVIFPNSSPSRSQAYLERVHTTYTGGLARLGYTYYFDGRNRSSRLSGLYTGVDLSAIQTFEEQTLTFRFFDNGKTITTTGINKFWTAGIAAHIGYEWLLCNGLMAINTRLQHPFYYPFTEEINISSPFAGNHWELNVGVGLRIGTY